MIIASHGSTHTHMQKLVRLQVPLKCFDPGKIRIATLSPFIHAYSLFTNKKGIRVC